VSGISMSVDYFRLDLSETVTTGIGPGAILSDLGQYGNLVTRGATDPAFPNLPGRIIDIDQRFVNLGKVRISGLDVGVQAALPANAAGRFRFSMQGTYTIMYDVQQQDGSWAGFVSTALFSPVTGITPRWKSYQSIDWEKGAWSVHLGNSYQSSYTDLQPDLDGNERTVSSMTLWDLQVGWKPWKNLALSAGVRNLLDTNPPLTNQNVTFQAGYDPSYYDARGRLVYVQASYSFK